jgi:hypothetical protein
MLKKMLLTTCFATASINAAMFAGITDKGFDFGLCSDKIDFVLQGEFNYLSADANTTAWTLSLSPDIEYLLFRTVRFKLYGMSGVYIIYGWYSAPYLNLGYFGDIYNDQQEITAGVNLLVLRPEAIISKNVSIYADIPIFQWERGTQAGQSIWLVGGYPNGSGYPDESAAIGIKFYF